MCLFREEKLIFTKKNVKINLGKQGDLIVNVNDNRLEDLKYEKDLKSKEISDMLKVNESTREWEEKLNYSFSTLASYERGEKLINSEILINISSITNYSLDWILGRTEEKQIKKE